MRTSWTMICRLNRILLNAVGEEATHLKHHFHPPLRCCHFPLYFEWCVESSNIGFINCAGTRRSNGGHRTDSAGAPTFGMPESSLSCLAISQLNLILDRLNASGSAEDMNF
jgi:hypothetical protein